MTDVTEAEAKTKWCPMSRSVWANFNDDGPGFQIQGNQAAFNRVIADDGPKHAEMGTCIGSACMMWRQGLKRNPDWKPRHQMMSGYPAHPDDEERPYIVDPERGSCGLARST